MNKTTRTNTNDGKQLSAGRTVRPRNIFLTATALLSFSLGLSAYGMKAVPMVETEDYAFGISGYLRTGIGTSEGGETQAHFQAPGALNKYSMGNQADTYGELEFDYTHYLNKDHSKSLDLVWMVSGYEAFDSPDGMSYNHDEQLYLRLNNFFNNNIDLWVGNRFYERQAIHMLDRQWNNPGQGGTGFGIEGLLDKGTNEDIKLALFGFEDDDVTSYSNGATDTLDSYTLDWRWVHIPLNENLKLNLNANYSYRAENDTLDYNDKDGFGVSSWVDYEKGHVTDTVGLLVRQGATVTINHWLGTSEKENPGNDSLILNDLNTAYTVELNNNYLYDDKDRFAFNGIFLAQYRDYGTTPHEYGEAPDANLGDSLFWLSLGGRGLYYISNQFRLSLELTNDYIDNQTKDISGNLSKITFSPEFALAKGFYARPVLRPFVTYAMWDEDLKGYVGNTPGSAPYGDKTEGFTAGLQFEIWW